MPYVSRSISHSPRIRKMINMRELLSSRVSIRVCAINEVILTEGRNDSCVTSRKDFAKCISRSLQIVYRRYSGSAPDSTLVKYVGKNRKPLRLPAGSNRVDVVAFVDVQNRYQESYLTLGTAIVRIGRFYPGNFKLSRFKSTESSRNGPPSSISFPLCRGNHLELRDGTFRD